MTGPEEHFDSTFFGAPGDKFLLPLRGYPTEKDAIFIALITAEYFGTELHVLHVTSKNIILEEHFHKQLARLQEQACEMRVNVEITILEESNYSLDEIIVQKIKEIAPKLTIMMSRRKGLLQKLSGSVAESVARKSPYSVLVIRSPIKDWTIYGSHIEPRKIVVPIGSDAPFEILTTQLAIAIANAGKSKDAEIILLHVIIIPETVPITAEDDEDDDIIIQEEKAFVKQAGKYSAMMMFPMTTRVILGRDIGRSISHFVNKEQPDLLLLGLPYLPRKFFGLYGTDTNYIRRKSICPVMMFFYKSP